MKVVDKIADKIVKDLRPNERLSSTTKKGLANEINHTFLSRMSIFEPLLLNYFHRPVVSDDALTLTPADVFEKLINLIIQKKYTALMAYRLGYLKKMPIFSLAQLQIF